MCWHKFSNCAKTKTKFANFHKNLKNSLCYFNKRYSGYVHNKEIKFLNLYLCAIITYFFRMLISTRICPNDSDFGWINKHSQFCCRRREMRGRRRAPVVRPAITLRRFHHRQWATRPWVGRWWRQPCSSKLRPASNRPWLSCRPDTGSMVPIIDIPSTPRAERCCRLNQLGNPG